MRDPKRIPLILRKLEKLWLRAPDLRLGQLLMNAAAFADSRDCFYLEDAALVKAVENSLSGRDAPASDRHTLRAGTTVYGPYDQGRGFVLEQDVKVHIAPEEPEKRGGWMP